MAGLRGVDISPAEEDPPSAQLDRSLDPPIRSVKAHKRPKPSGGRRARIGYGSNLCGPSKEEAMVDIRKIITMREMVLPELGVAAPRPIVRAVDMAVILKPFAGRVVDDLRPLFEAGRCSASD